jgi:hypothetical protein
MNRIIEKMTPESTVNQRTRKQYYLRFLFLFISIIGLILFYYILVDLGGHPIIAVLIILFVFLLITGILFKGSNKTLYSKMFPERNRTRPYEKNKSVKEKKGIEHIQPKILKPINLSTKYYKPIVLKCRNCGNLIPNFVKLCPFCNKKVKI